MQVRERRKFKVFPYGKHGCTCDHMGQCFAPRLTLTHRMKSDHHGRMRMAMVVKPLRMVVVVVVVMVMMMMMMMMKMI